MNMDKMPQNVQAYIYIYPYIENLWKYNYITEDNTLTTNA